CVQLVMIGDVVAMQTIRARLKIGRRVNVTNSQCSQIRHDLACLGKSELAIELQAVGADWNTRPLLFGHIMSSRVETPISNDEIRMTKSETVPDLSRRFHHSLVIRHSSFFIGFTSSQALVSQEGPNRASRLAQLGRIKPGVSCAWVPLTSAPGRPRKMCGSCSPPRTDNLPKYLAENRSALGERSRRTDKDVWRDQSRRDQREPARRFLARIRLFCEK